MGLERRTGLVDWNVGLEHCSAKQKLLTYNIGYTAIMHMQSILVNTTKKINHTCIYPQWETITFGSI